MFSFSRPYIAFFFCFFPFLKASRGFGGLRLPCDPKFVAAKFTALAGVKLDGGG